MADESPDGPDSEPDETAAANRRLVPPFLWPALAVVLTLVAMHGAFSLSSVFFARDLGGFWWPQHVWAASALRSGELPLWDPGIGMGQSAIADPIRHLLFPPAVILRLLLPDVLSFNLLVALPFPIAALGMYFFLRRRREPIEASLGAIAFALSGPMLSSGNLLTLSWTLALLPLSLAIVDRLATRTDPKLVALLAFVVTLLVLAGEPVSLCFAILVIAAYTILPATSGMSWKGRVSMTAVVAGAGLLGMLLASAQLLPLVEAVSRSRRELAVVNYAWPVHPFNLLGLVSSGLFEEMSDAWTLPHPIMGAMYAGHFSYLSSIYLGVATVALAVLAVFGRWRDRWVLFWVGIALVSLIAALGAYTPIYPALQSLVPIAKTFRYPSKFILFTAFAVAVLACEGLAVLRASKGHRDKGIIAAAALSFTIGIVAAALWAASTSTSSAPGLFDLMTITWRGEESSELAWALDKRFGDAMPLVVALSAIVGMLLLAVLRGAPGKMVSGAFVALISLDLLAAHLHLNPTIDAELVSSPPWLPAISSRPPGRVFVGRKAYPLEQDEGAESARMMTGAAPADTPLSVVGAGYGSVLLNYWAPWGVREVISIDLTDLAPQERAYATSKLVKSDEASREAFLSRADTRFFITPRQPTGGRLLTQLPAFGATGVFEGPEPSPRVSIVTSYGVEADVQRQVDALFDPNRDESTGVLLTAEPPAQSGKPGVPASVPGATIETETGDSISMIAHAPAGGGLLLLRDSYDPGWEAAIDGEPAQVLRADGLFRAVHVTKGEHSISLKYRPRSFRTGVLVSSFAVIVTLVLLGVGLRRRQGD